MSVSIEPMSEDDIKDLLNSYDFVARVNGFKDGDEMESFKVDASLGMIKFGGSFTSSLGLALAHADSKNTAKIIWAFRDDCEKYAAFFKKYAAEQYDNNGGDNDR